MTAFFLPPDVVSVTPLAQRCVRVEYANGVIGVADLKPLLLGNFFSRIRDDDTLFRKVAVNEVGTICWPDGTDIAPECLYEAMKPELSALG